MDPSTIPSSIPSPPFPSQSIGNVGAADNFAVPVETQQPADVISAPLPEEVVDAAVTETPETSQLPAQSSVSATVQVLIEAINPVEASVFPAKFPSGAERKVVKSYPLKSSEDYCRETMLLVTENHNAYHYKDLVYGKTPSAIVDIPISLCYLFENPESIDAGQLLMWINLEKRLIEVEILDEDLLDYLFEFNHITRDSSEYHTGDIILSNFPESSKPSSEAPSEEHTHKAATAGYYFY